VVALFQMLAYLTSIPPRLPGPDLEDENALLSEDLLALRPRETDRAVPAARRPTRGLAGTHV
jgi:hypothetical protein